MTKDGKSAKEMRVLHSALVAKARADTAMLHRAAGYQYEESLARNRENSRRKRAARKAA